MPQFGIIRAIVIASVLLLADTFGSLIAAETASDWLRGSGTDLQIRLRGEVLNSDGQPATDFRVIGKMLALTSSMHVEPKVNGHHFEFWIPANQFKAYAMSLTAVSSAADRVAYRSLEMFQLRQAAIDGIKLTLASPTRTVDVKVVEKDQPVANATVTVDFGFSMELPTRTNAEGIARIGLPSEHSMIGLMAWTDDFRIGGFTFGRKPVRDPDRNEQVIELSRCRDQKLRFVDEEGSPVPGVDFVIRMATAPPNYNYIGTNEHSHMTTDAAGEAIDKWFPDWDDHHFYAELKSNQWILEGVHQTIGDTIVFKLKKSKIADRRRITGQVVSNNTSVAGFFVKLESFQAEQKSQMDQLWAFSDSDGTFTADVLPDATYCASVLDSRWVSEIIDLIPYQTTTGRTIPPELSVSEGEPIEVIVTTGPQKETYPKLKVSFLKMHDFQWQEGSATRNGRGGSKWWAMTDEFGRATTRALPGKLTTSIYTPSWRIEKTVEVNKGETVKIELHRDHTVKQKISGRLILAEGLESTLKGTELHIGSIDGTYDDEQTVRCNEDGSFSFATLSTELGLFASTKDGLAAGSLVIKDLRSPIEMRLRPTIDFHGQVLGEGAQPLRGQRILAIVSIESDRIGDTQFSTRFQPKRIESLTDDLGNYSLSALPAETKIDIQTLDKPDATRSRHLDSVYLEANESRPRAVSPLASAAGPASKRPLADRYKGTLRNCDVSGFQLMVILKNDADDSDEFVERHLASYQLNKETYPFMPLVISSAPEGLDSADAAFMKLKNWRLPGEGRIVAYMIDAKGNERESCEFAVAAKEAAVSAAEFVKRHAPVKIDATEKWDKAFAEAKRSGRRVWVRISQKWCGPCHRLARWIDDHREILEREFVLLKVDDFYDENGEVIAQRLTQGKQHGIPFFALFDDDGKRLIDSAGPLGNIGYPSNFDERKHFGKMLRHARQNLTEDQINQLIDSLGQ